MTTTNQGGKPPSSSRNPPDEAKYKNSLGQEIPAEAFENDIGAPRELASFMSEKDLEEFDREIAEQKARVEKLRSK